MINQPTNESSKRQPNIRIFWRMTLLFLGIAGLLSVGVAIQYNSANASEQPAITCSGKPFVMPSTIEASSDAFGDFLRIASLPSSETRKLFRSQSNEQKASFVRLNLALQLVKRPDLTKQQQDFVLDAISNVTPETFDQSDRKNKTLRLSGTEREKRALDLFPAKEAGDFIEPLAMNKDEEAALLQKYEDLLKNGSKSRMGLAAGMAVNDRVNIWKVQLAYHLATGKFSKPQREFIMEMMNSLSPNTFATRDNAKREEEGKALAYRIYSVFTKDEGWAIFMTLGIQKYVKDAQVATNTLYPEATSCQCLASCPGDQTCGSEHGCMSTPDGCGPWGWLGCHYMCEGGDPLITE